MKELLTEVWERAKKLRLPPSPAAPKAGFRGERLLTLGSRLEGEEGGNSAQDLVRAAAAAMNLKAVVMGGMRKPLPETWLRAGREQGGNTLASLLQSSAGVPHADPGPGDRGM